MAANLTDIVRNNETGRKIETFAGFAGRVRARTGLYIEELPLGEERDLLDGTTICRRDPYLVVTAGHPDFEEDDGEGGAYPVGEGRAENFLLVICQEAPPARPGVYEGGWVTPRSWPAGQTNEVPLDLAEVRFLVEAVQDLDEVDEAATGALAARLAKVLLAAPWGAKGNTFIADRAAMFGGDSPRQRTLYIQGRIVATLDYGEGSSDILRVWTPEEGDGARAAVKEARRDVEVSYQEARRKIDRQVEYRPETVRYSTGQEGGTLWIEDADLPEVSARGFLRTLLSLPSEERPAAADAAAPFEGIGQVLYVLMDRGAGSGRVVPVDLYADEGPEAWLGPHEEVFSGPLVDEPEIVDLLLRLYEAELRGEGEDDYWVREEGEEVWVLGE